MSLPKLSIFLLLSFCVRHSCMAQDDSVGFSKANGHMPVARSRRLSENLMGFATDSGYYLFQIIKTNCKNFQPDTLFIPAEENAIVISKPKITIPPVRAKFITVHGNIAYDYLYRSKIDTPFNQLDLKQHTERVSLDIMFKARYPFKVYFTARQSNSAFFKNFIDPNIQFDKYTYEKIQKAALLDQIAAKLAKRPALKRARDSLQSEEDKLARLTNWARNPGTLQRLIEEREKKYYQKKKQLELPAPDSLRVNAEADSLLALGDAAIDIDSASILKEYEQKKREIEATQQKVARWKSRIDSISAVAQKDLLLARQKIYQAKNAADINKVKTENGINADSTTRFEMLLSGIKTFDLGKSVLNYTELTAQNVIITGINVEYNPSFYVAFAAGKLDYRFRDFFNKGTKNTGQNLVMGRIGLGNKDKKAVILTFFKGRKNQSEFALNDSINNYVNIVGYSLETIIKKNEFTGFSAEFAKSTKPVTGSFQNKKQLNSLLRFGDKTNMGINIKGFTQIPATQTKLNGFFRKTGENYQSFSLFSYNTDQTAWLARLDQDLFNHKVTFTGMLRRNDFTNPLTQKTFKTSTTFKSLLLNVHVPKYPTLSLGYYPGTQLYVVDKETFRENAYYILNGSASYSYFVKGLGMNTTLVYNRYFNKATDSGFVLYKGINYYMAQTIFLKQLQLQAGYAYTQQPELTYYTLEASADYNFKKTIKLGAGLKENKVIHGKEYLGKRILLGLDLKRLGTFQFQYEKSYLPTLSQTLYPVEIGRISWYKYF